MQLSSPSGTSCAGFLCRSVGARKAQAEPLGTTSSRSARQMSTSSVFILFFGFAFFLFSFENALADGEPQTTLASGTASPSIPYYEDPCSLFASIHASAPKATWTSYVLSFLHRSKAPQLTPTSADPNAVYFTTGSGYAWALTCAPGPSTQVEPSLYYPMGLVVRKLSETHWRQKGVDTQFTYVTAEYGLRFYLPSEQLHPIEADKAYIFNAGLGAVPYCLGDRNCKNHKKGQVLQANLRYALVDFATQPDARTLLEGNSCGTVSVMLYDKLAHPAENKSAYLSTCLKSQEGKMEPIGLKVVTADAAKRRFSFNIDGSFERYSASVLRLVDPSVVSIKECGWTTKDNSSFVLSGDLGASLKLGLVDSDFKMQREVTKEIEKTLVEGEYYLFSMYSYHQLAPDESNDWKFRDIYFSAKCDSTNQYPTTPTVIVIENSTFPPPNTLTIVIDDLLASSYFKSYGNKSYANSNTNSIQKGLFWRIDGVDEYLRWEAALQAYLQEQPSVQSVTASLDPEEQQWVVDFFAHLILASAFQFNPTKAPPGVVR
jgi:hypothetical protein